MYERERERKRGILKTLSHFYKFFQTIKILTSNLNFFTWFKWSQTFHTFNKPHICFPLFTFVQMTHPCAHFVLVWPKFFWTIFYFTQTFFTQFFAKMSFWCLLFWTKIFQTKYFLDQNILDIDPKYFLDAKYFWTQIFFYIDFFYLHIFWAFLGPKICFWRQFFQTKIFGPIFFWNKIFLA